LKRIYQYLDAGVSIAPLAIFRLCFGLVMLVSSIRFLMNGWVEKTYVQPKFFFGYAGFEWIKPLDANGMYVVFASMAFFALLITLGLFYRFAIWAFFLLFTYTELIDKTNYLNHYYYITIIGFLLLFVPAHRFFSLDIVLFPSWQVRKVPRWNIGIFKLQLAIFYLFAGMAKLNSDWLFEAESLRTCLLGQASLPLLGGLLTHSWSAYVLAWGSMLFDFSIPFFLLIRRTRIMAFGVLALFHLTTFLLFPIGLFPFMMILSSLIFFSESWHKNLIARLRMQAPEKVNYWTMAGFAPVANPLYRSRFQPLMLWIMVAHFSFQLAMPMRHFLYEKAFFWNEHGLHFSWHLLFNEKAATVYFQLTDPKTKKTVKIINSDYLSRQQEKVMSTQPEMIVQFAQFLKEEYRRKGMQNPIVKVGSSQADGRKNIDLAMER
jgi:Vitamin K-dependent gamma-carboxylase